MSLFANDQYCWRETYFVLFRAEHRPDCEVTVAALSQLGNRYQLEDVRADDQGRLESLTLLAPFDFAAMDISLVTGEEVAEQLAELEQELEGMPLTPEEKEKLSLLPDCDARFDVYHFEQVASDPDNDEEFLDPGALLIVLETLTQLCEGVGIDPQSGTVM